MDKMFSKGQQNLTPASILENRVLHNSKEFFKPTRPFKNSPSYNGQKRNSVYNEKSQPTSNSENNQGGESFWNRPFCWTTGPSDSLPVEFCQETSIHGLKFVAIRRKRHLCERIFWLIAFCLGLIGASLLISDVWERYKANPVIVTFEPKEQDIDGLPFPAVTICNINKFAKSKVEKIMKLAESDGEESKQAQKHLSFIRNVCNAQMSFAKKFDFAGLRGIINLNESIEIDEDDQDDMLDFLMEFSTSCEEMIRLCLFGEKVFNCTKLFKPFITDYGKCCTFNILPYPLLMKDPRVDASETLLSDDNIWDSEEIDLWKKWKYVDGVTLDKSLPYPYRQTRAGMPYGLSILLDPNIDEYFCPASDSEGFLFAINTPLEMPHVAEFANILAVDKEIYVEINPDVINADDDVKAFDLKSRKCLFGTERTLDFFHPYTGKNCIDECTAEVITLNCSCSYFYMPRPDGVKVCNTKKHSKDEMCIDQTKVGLLGALQEICGHCDGLCENLQYDFQVTVAKMQKAEELWGYATGNATIQKWANNTMSIVHIFFGADTIVPKLRKRLYGPTDLIASTGGLLGLCLGVSILSVVEAIYYCTIRAFCKFCGRRHNNNNELLVTKLFNVIKKKAGSGKNKTITLNPDVIPMYSHNTVPVISVNDRMAFMYGHLHQH